MSADETYDPERAGKLVEMLRALADRIREAAGGSANVLPPIREALHSLATVGEVCGVLRDVWGTYDAQRARP